jgi:hypothetical protein
MVPRCPRRLQALGRRAFHELLVAATLACPAATVIAAPRCCADLPKDTVRPLVMFLKSLLKQRLPAPNTM